MKSQGHKTKRLVDNTLSKASWQNCEKVFAIEVLTSVDMHDCLLTDLRLRANYNFASWTIGLICSPYILSPAFCKTSWITQIELSKLTFSAKILVCCPSNILIFWRELLGLSVFTIFSFLLILVCCHCWKNYFLCSAFDHTFI